MVTVPAQFNGPDHSGNGGYVCGMLARELGGPGPVTSTLHLPPPLDTALSWEHDGDELRLLTAGGAVIGHAGRGAFTRDVPTMPTPEQAEAGLAAYPGFAHHPFDHCFTCGTRRDDGEGLRLFTGPISPGLVAAPWTPHAAFGGADDVIDEPVMWSALDCPGGWSADFTVQTMVLGRMTAEVLRRPAVGQACVATGRLHAQEGRKFLTDTALHTADGELLGRAEQVWIQVDAPSGG